MAESEVYRCRKQIAESGAVVYIPIAQTSAVAGLAAIAAQLSAVKSAVAAAGGQVPRSVAAVAGTALAPTLADNAANAFAALVAGDYIGLLKFGLPALLGISGALVAVLTPSPQAALLSTDQLQALIAGLSAEQRQVLLDGLSPAGAEAAPVPTVVA